MIRFYELFITCTLTLLFTLCLRWRSSPANNYRLWWISRRYIDAFNIVAITCWRPTIGHL